MVLRLRLGRVLSGRRGGAVHGTCRGVEAGRGLGLSGVERRLLLLGWWWREGRERRLLRAVDVPQWCGPRACGATARAFHGRRDGYH